MENNGVISKTDYCGPFVYETVSGTRSLKYIISPEGRVVKNGSNWDYEYNLTDHLGNVRIVIHKGSNGLAEVVQERHYYPFGMEMSTLSSDTSTNKYLFNGKELQNNLLGGVNLDWYDYGARFYDPQIGRFHTQDRFAEKYWDFSPYQYAANNPMLFIDVNGDSINVALIQRYDQQNNTNILNTIINDLQSQTGLTYTVSATGQLTYQTDQNGNAVVATTTDQNGNTVNVGSQEARDLMTNAIGNTTTAYARITTGRSSAPVGGTLINLNENQINSFISGARNVDSRTLGWGMTFMHETSHSVVGGSLSDHLPQGSTTGQVVDRMNIVRSQLNQQGGNYGQRVVYQGTTFSPTGTPAYLPFDNNANSNLQRGLVPATTSQYVTF
ncbi:MAG: RHS repeat-associated core domain-containing protein [Bacteroidales bacterium]